MAEEPRHSKRQPRFCGHCGEPLNRSQRFCTYCGEPIEEGPPISLEPRKVTPISPEARRALEDFENQLAAMRMKRAQSSRGGAASRQPDMKVLLYIGATFFVLLIMFFYFMVRYVSGTAGAF